MNDIKEALDLVQQCLDDWPYAATRVIEIMTRLERVKELLEKHEERSGLDTLFVNLFGEE